MWLVHRINFAIDRLQRHTLELIAWSFADLAANSRVSETLPRLLPTAKPINTHQRDYKQTMRELETRETNGNLRRFQ